LSIPDAGPVAKGGIAIQPCDWIATLPFFGAVGESRYIKDTHILKQQQEFATNDKTSNEPFTNVFYRGYQLTLFTHQHGKQKCEQPHIVKNDCAFDTEEVLGSAQVAAMRSENESAVRVSNISWGIKHGNLLQCFKLSTLTKVWTVWGFVVNFMYSPVH
jgi:hypothetical protein